MNTKEELNKMLVEAIISENVEEASRLIKLGADPNTTLYMFYLKQKQIQSQKLKMVIHLYEENFE